MMTRYSSVLAVGALLCVSSGYADMADLQRIMSDLREGKGSPPTFLTTKRPNATDEAKFGVFLGHLKASREAAVRGGFADDNYARLLLQVHEYFSDRDSYLSLLLSDCSKRLLLEWAREQLLRSGVKRIEDVDALVRRTTLKATSLETLYGAEAKPEWFGKQVAPPIDLLEGSQRLWESHGYHTTNENYRGTADVLRENIRRMDSLTSTLLGEYQPVPLGLRVLATERLRSGFYEGTKAFLQRGGDVGKVDLADIRYFNSVMPRAECKKYVFTQ